MITHFDFTMENLWEQYTEMRVNFWIIFRKFWMKANDGIKIRDKKLVVEIDAKCTILTS